MNSFNVTARVHNYSHWQLIRGLLQFFCFSFVVFTQMPGAEDTPDVPPINLYALYRPLG